MFNNKYATLHLPDVDGWGVLCSRTCVVCGGLALLLLHYSPRVVGSAKGQQVS